MWRYIPDKLNIIRRKNVNVLLTWYGTYYTTTKNSEAVTQTKIMHAHTCYIYEMQK